MLELELGVPALLDARLLADLVGGQGRPAVGGVADQVVVGADPLAPVHGEGLDARQDGEAGAHVHGRVGARRLARLDGGRPARAPAPVALHAPDEVEHLLGARVEDDHEVVGGELADLGEAGLPAVPAVLVVEDHRLPRERLQLGHAVEALDDVRVAVARVVGVVREEVVGEVAGVGEALRHRRLDGGQLRPRALLVAEHVEQDAEDLVLGPLVPGRAERSVPRLDPGHQPGAVPRREDRQEHVVAATGHVAPARGALVVHRHRVAVDPEQVEREIPQQLVAPAVEAALEPRHDVGLGRSLLLEVAPDDRRELLEALEDREVELREEVEGKDEAPVAVDDEGLHWRRSSAPTGPAPR